MIFLTGCAGVSSDAPPGACPPVVEYSRAEQASVAEEVAALPEGALIPDWIADYAVLRDQARACARRQPFQTRLAFRPDLVLPWAAIPEGAKVGLEHLAPPCPIIRAAAGGMCADDQFR